MNTLADLLRARDAANAAAGPEARGNRLFNAARRAVENLTESQDFRADNGCATVSVSQPGDRQFTMEEKEYAVRKLSDKEFGFTRVECESSSAWAVRFSLNIVKPPDLE